MKAEEVMLGDWIAYIPEIADGEDSYLGEPRNIQVNMSSFTRMEELIFAPIPLTPEILAKNGFEIQEIRLWYTIYNPKYKNHTIVAYYDEDDGDVAIPFRGHWAFDENYAFDYVHELQHALRLCGLNDLADNFKI